MTRPCPSCGTEAATRSARWCNSCGASLAGSAPASDEPSVHPGAARGPRVGAGAALAVLLALGATVLAWGDRSADAPPEPATPPAAGEVELSPDAGELGPGTGGLGPEPTLDDPLADEWAVEPGDAAVFSEEDRSAADGRSRPSCEIDGCALWRGTLLGTGPVGVDARQAVGVDARQAVAARDELLVAVDVDTGRLRWRVAQPLPDRVVTAVYVDEQVVAVATEAAVSVLDPGTGAVRGTSEKLDVVVYGFTRVDGRLLAIGADATEPFVIGLDDDAQVRFARAGWLDPFLPSASAPMLVEHDEAIARLDATTGDERWSVPLDGRVRDGLTLLDPASGEIQVLDPDRGEPLLSLVVDGAIAAGVRSGVLVATTRDRVVLLGRDGTERVEVTGIDPERVVVTSAGSEVTLVELPSDGTDPRIEVRQVTETVPDLPGPADLHLVPGANPYGEVQGTVRRDGLLVASNRGAWLVAPGSRTAVPADVPVGGGVRHVDGLSVLTLADGLELAGAGGRLRVQGAPRVLSLDPLLVRGWQGTLRLDRALLDG